ncbi:MAG: choice-of-anchor B family protein, partial [Rhodothermales bacterium]
IDVTDPHNPTFAGCYAEVSSVRALTGYTHDTQCVNYHGPDPDYAGREICVSSNENSIVITDVTVKSAPVTVAVAEYPAFAYTHQGWLTPDHTHFLLDDELDELPRSAMVRTRTLIWNLEDLDDPLPPTLYAGTTTSIDHNQYIVEKRAFQANYASGLRILDLTDVTHPVEVGFFDTFPAHDSAMFVGAWSNYPFFESGIVVISSINEGFFVVQPTGQAKTAIARDEVPTDFRLLPPYPNPFNPQTTVTLEVDQPQHVRLTVYDALGKELSTLFSGVISSPGRREVLFDGSALPSGVYLIRATGRSGIQAITVTLQK